MRIIAGTARGMNIISPKGNDTRPITDRVKEAIFSIIYKYDMPKDCIVADVFSGTGSFGLEALSRGAKSVTFVELSRNVVELLNRNIEKARFQDRSNVIRANAFKAGAPREPDSPKYDIVFYDPPYPMSYDTALNSRLGKGLLVLNEQVREGGLVLVRTHRRAHLLERYGNLEVIDRREWGSMAETFLMLNPVTQTELEQENHES